MSATGAIMDAVGAAAVGAIAELTSGNVSRGVGLIEELPDSAFPHAYLTADGDAPLETVTLATHLQEEVTYRVALALVFRERTQEETLGDLDAVRAAIRADRTLGGLVRWSYVAELSLVEREGDRAERIGILAVSALEEA